MDNNEVKLPDFLNDIIRKEKRDGVAKFDISDFEKKIYNRIRDQESGRRRISKWVLAPALTVVLLIFSMFMFRGDNEDISGKSQLQLVFEKVILEIPLQVELPGDLIKEKKFENLQNELMESVIKSGIDTSKLSEQITSSLISATGEYEAGFLFPEEFNRNILIQIKEDISNMNKKDDYSELFSRIIEKITEG